MRVYTDVGVVVIRLEGRVREWPIVVKWWISSEECVIYSTILGE